MMSKVQISAANLLQLVASARISTNAVSAADALFALKSQLLQYRDDLVAEGRETVTALAIENWFREEKRALPTHKTSRRFLNGYLTRLAVRTKLSGEKQRTILKVMQFVEAAGMPQIKTAGKAAATEKWDERDVDTLHQFLALEGTYQLIRPHSVEPNVYVLEPFAIDVNKGERIANVRMYSHNQRAGDRVYSGELYATYHYGYSLIHRQHESNPTRLAFRCIAFFVASQREGEGYLSQPCLSGLISRGVAAIVGPTRMMGTPFIAIKANDYSSDFLKPDFEDFGDELRRLHKKGNILSGKLAGKTALHRLCHDLFERLKHDLISGLVMYAIEPDKVEAAIVKTGGGTTKDLFSVWGAAVQTQFGGSQAHKKAVRKKRKIARSRR
jgi:hypothetical protein